MVSFRLICAAALAGAVTELAAQTITLDNFNSGTASGAVIASPIPSTWVNNVTQNAGSITIGGTARDDNGWGASGLSFNASATNYVQISGRLEPGNAAQTLSVQLLDANLNSVFFSVSTSAFTTGTTTQVQIPITSWDAGFNPAQLSSWNIGGGTTGFVAFRMTLDNLALSASPILLSGGGRIVTAGDQAYASAITLDAPTTLGSTGSNGNAITFSSTLNGAHDLTLETPGTTTLSGAVGHTTPLASLTTDAGGMTVIAGGNVFTSGSQTYGDTVSLGAATHLKSTQGSVSLLGSVLGNGHALTVEVAQASSLHSASNLGALFKSGAGTLTLSGQSTSVGQATLNAGTLALGLAHALPAATPLTLGGGVFATGGYSQTLGQLTLTGSATIDFGNGTSTLVFADSHSATWTGTLSIYNFTTGSDALRFGTDAGGLTTHQLAQIDFGPGFTATIDASGYVVGASAIPEPGTYALIVGGALFGAALFRRRRNEKQRRGRT